MQEEVYVPECLDGVGEEHGAQHTANGVHAAVLDLAQVLGVHELALDDVAESLLVDFELAGSEHGLGKVGRQHLGAALRVEALELPGGLEGKVAGARRHVKHEPVLVGKVEQSQGFDGEQSAEVAHRVVLLGHIAPELGVLRELGCALVLLHCWLEAVVCQPKCGFFKASPGFFLIGVLFSGTKLVANAVTRSFNSA
jgi:hypothetical protein